MATGEDLRRTEDRLGKRIDEVRSETRDTIGKFHDRANKLESDQATATAERKAMIETQDKFSTEMAAGRQSLTDVHAALKDATSSFSSSLEPVTSRIDMLSDSYLEAKEERELEKTTAAQKLLDEEETRRNWWKDWRKAATPQNFVALLVLMGAVSAFFKGQSDTSELLQAVQEAQAIQEAPGPPQVTPDMAPGD